MSLDIDFGMRKIKKKIRNKNIIFDEKVIYKDIDTVDYGIFV
jgi:hypothetical protein